MAACPHCHEDTLDFLQRVTSSRAAPARCSECDGMSRIAESPTHWRSVGLDGAALIAFFIGVFTWFWLGIVTFLVLAGLMVRHAMGLARQPMIAMSRMEAEEAQHHAFLFAAGLLAIAAVVVAWTVSR